MNRNIDIFISFKHLDSKGNKTRDSLIAEELFHYLRRSGLKVFFSNLSLETLGRSQFRQMIDNALDHSKILIVVGTTKGNIESKWVRYEWESFDTDILSGVNETGEIFSYLSNITPRELPRPMRNRQSVSHDQEGMSKLKHLLISALNPDKSTFEAVKNVSSNSGKPTIDEYTDLSLHAEAAFSGYLIRVLVKDSVTGSPIRNTRITLTIVHDSRHFEATENQSIIPDLEREYPPIASFTLSDGELFYGILPDLVPVGKISCVISAYAYDYQPTHKPIIWPKFIQKLCILQHRGASWAVPLSKSELVGREPDETIAFNLIPQ
jgi:hypothetical protein